MGTDSRFREPNPKVKSDRKKKDVTPESAGMTRADKGIGPGIVSSTVSATVRASLNAVFNWFVPVKLQDILPGYGPLPAVVRTGQTGPWEQPGSHRTVHLADGNTAQEEVTACEYSHYFAYRVSGFTNILRYFTHEAQGQWWFEDAGDSTKVKWTYTFNARSSLGKLVLIPIVKLLWKGYMRVAMRAVKEHAEKEAVVDFTAEAQNDPKAQQKEGQNAR